MSTQKPRDLCKRTFLFACDIVAFCRTLSKEPGAPRQISGQLLRAGTSVGANTEEAKAASATRLAQPEAVAALIQEANEPVGIFTATVRKAKQPVKVRS
jgi:four helix bundle protein